VPQCYLSPGYLNPGTLYHYVAGKDELLIEVMRSSLSSEPESRGLR
jgi:AcrR family transcriptional regulator